MKSEFSIKSLAFSIVFLSAGIGFANEQEEEFTEATQKERNAAAIAKLKSNPGSVSVYVKGLCCPSCSIGVRKKISRLSFVDKGRFNKGVELDTKVQLATVALKEGQSPDSAALAEAVEDAGYDPVHLYRLDGEALKSTSLTKP